MQPIDSSKRSDVVIVGGGPAGLATAIRARIKGLDVVVLEASKPTIDRACGEGLMPDAVDRLRELGVNLQQCERRPYYGIRYVEGSTSAEGRFPGVHGLGIRRTVLHEALHRRAIETGVQIHWGLRVRGISEDGFETDEGLFRGRWLIGADGRYSKVRKWAGLAGRPASRRRFGIRRHFEIEPWTDLVEVHWVDGFEAYVTPVGERLVGVVLMWGEGKADFDSLMRRFPALEERFSGSAIATSDRGAGPLEQRCREVYRGNLALVGDASGSLDAISGEGLALAFHESFAVVDAILAGNLVQYSRARTRIVRYPKMITRLLLLLEELPSLRRRVMRSLSSDPSLMSRFLELKMRGDRRRVLGANGLLQLTMAAVRGGI